MRSRWIILVVALVLGGLAALATGRYLEAVRSQVAAGAQPIAVLVAKEDIPKGTSVDDIISKGKAETRQIPQQYVAAGAVSSLRTVDGQVLAIPLAKGEQVTANRFMFSSEAGLAFGIPKNYLALSLPSDDIRGVAGLVKAGDNVVVFGSIKTNANDENSWQTKVLVTGARVLAVGRSTGADTSTNGASNGSGGLLGQTSSSSSASPLTPTTITIAISPRDGERVVLTEEIGKVWLALLPTEAKSTVKGSGQLRMTVLR